MMALRTEIGVKVSHQVYATEVQGTMQACLPSAFWVICSFCDSEIKIPDESR